MIEFFLPIKPPTKTHQGKKVTCKNGKPVFYEPDELKQVRAKFMAHIGPYTPEKPLVGPVQLITKWCWPTNGRVPSGTWKDTAPDTDNVIKLPKDVMQDLGFFSVADGQVASEITQTFWADPAGVYIRIEELTGMGEHFYDNSYLAIVRSFPVDCEMTVERILEHYIPSMEEQVRRLDKAIEDLDGNQDFASTIELFASEAKMIRAHIAHAKQRLEEAGIDAKERPYRS